MRRYVFAALIFSLPCPAQFVPASSGCSQAHCDPQLDDAVRLTPPTSLVSQCTDSVAQGSNAGGGLSSNGYAVAATYANNAGYAGPFLKVYDASVAGGGPCHVLWTSNILDDQAWRAVPLLGSHTAAIPDMVIAADDTQIVEFDGSGRVLWDTCWYGGTAPSCRCSDRASSPPCGGGNYPIEPVPLDDGSVNALVVGTHGDAGHPGLVFEVNSATGAIMGSEYLGLSGGNSNNPNNIPCVNSNTFFMITNYASNASVGVMYAIRVSNGVFNTVWSYNFHGPSGGSPLCLNSLSPPGVFSDGTDATNSSHSDLYGWNQISGALLYACLDTGGSGCPSIQGSIRTNSAADSRGGYWVVSPNLGTISRRSPDASPAGSQIQTIEVQKIIPGEPCNTAPSSDLSMSVAANGDNLMTLALQTLAGCNAGANSASYIAIMDANTGTLRSYWRLAADNTVAPGLAKGQFPIVLTTAGLPRLAFTSDLGGLVQLGAQAGDK